MNRCFVFVGGSDCLDGGAEDFHRSFASIDAANKFAEKYCNYNLDQFAHFFDAETEVIVSSFGDKS